MKYGSRKFIIALLLILCSLLITCAVLYMVPTAELVAIMPVLLGFDGVLLGAIAVMYPVANVFESSKWSNSDEP